MKHTHILVDACLRKELEQLELTERAQAEERVLEREDLLDGDLLACREVDCGDHGAICTLTETVEDAIIVACTQDVDMSAKTSDVA